MGLEAVRRCDRRVARLSLVTENGSGPDGSSLTVDYQRSKGSGAEKLVGQLVLIRAATSAA